ncbi:DUF3304 domain-containing protein [Ralstonia solanacearum]|nr:DUF3304 domain-containing protein [Ralstonia solanacearum]MDB0508090.1 DUF3304 domain-containing protein [Ralstonia solanacearum]MDB0512359.1 DUF3304 domain-containing protein [Ralstonia solanacearum]MDB0529541.1 DUF3304 domain-containing protein [Ralstonia solanacearum]MDB0568270.1 DUF3304 domain-containing protein [Ralstonia solanacearum]MDB0576753.1 DUF3304 domain-containing protein [Ralstonia solanacearum]
MTKRIWMVCVLVVLAALGTGCKPSQSQAAKADAEDELGLSVRVLNYTDIPLGVVYVNGIWVGNTSSHSGGHSIAGAIGVPQKWHPGLTVEVEWQDDLLYEKDPNGLYKAQVPVEPYDMKYGGFLWLAFFPDNKVRAIPSSTSPGFPGFPDGLEYPFDVCMADAACATKFYPERVAHSQKGQ